MYTQHPDFCSHPNKSGMCLVHNWSCPDCGFGRGQIPACTCKLEEKPEPIFGTHIREAVAVIKEMFK